jgi:ankyrin repeat protein
MNALLFSTAGKWTSLSMVGLLLNAGVVPFALSAEPPPAAHSDPVIPPEAQIQAAVMADDAAGVKSALAAGVHFDVLLTLPKGGRLPALFFAMKFGKIHAAQALWDAGARVGNEHVAQVSELVWQARGYRMPLMGEFALKHGADPKHVSPDGKSLVYQLAVHGDEKLLKMALDAGGDLELPDKSGMSPFVVAVRLGKFNHARVLLDAGANPLGEYLPEVLYDLLRAGQESFFMELVARPGAKVTPDEATRLLATTIYAGRVSPLAAAYLLKAGANPDLRDQSSLLTRSVDLPPLDKVLGGEGRFQYDLLREMGQTDLAAIYLQQASHPNGLDASGMNPFLKAARNGDAAEVKKMLDSGVWLEAPDAKEGRTALLWAVSEEKEDVLKALLDAGSDIHARDRSGADALLLAVRRNLAGIAGTLLAFGADPNLASGDSPSALAAARDAGRKDLCKLFEDAIAASDKVVWTEDFDAAVARARLSGKRLMLQFTGSDWCGYCRIQEKEVFDSFAFKARVGDRFELVRLDYPRKAKQDAALQERNARLKEQYKPPGYPTVVFIDAEGKELGRKVGYGSGTRAFWMKWLREQTAR